jgi:intraflagellar transport protein 88
MTHTYTDDDNEHASHDALRQWMRARRHHAERTILTGAKLISPCIAASFAAGYAWCVDSIKQSVYAELASDLEINKAIELLRARDLPGAASVLKSFEKKDSKVASAAANNLSFLRFLEGNLNEAAVFAEQAITIDRYNANALVNRGNVHFQVGIGHSGCVHISQANELELARQFYREALANEASCVEALYNLGVLIHMTQTPTHTHTHCRANM